MQDRQLRRPLWHDPLDDQDAADRQTASLGGVAVSLLLIVAGLFLVHVLHERVRLEDCVLSGRTNCVLLDVPNR